ncbi:MAG: hypothetical protein JNL21_21950 [Myxococcales bacterium]|nr:hypothetical protein [Myxococcales bacterium]
MKHFFRTIAFASVLATAACDHYSTQDAYAKCSEIVEVTEGVESALFEQCVACYENCGDECNQPRLDRFVCPDQEETSAGGAGGGS